MRKPGSISRTARAVEWGASSHAADEPGAAGSRAIDVKDRTGTQPRGVRRPGKPGHGFPEPAQDEVRHPEGPGTPRRKGQADRQEGVRRLEPLPELHGAVP